MAVLKVDKAYRRKFFALIFVLVLLLLAGVYWTPRALADYLCGKSVGEAFRAMEVVLQVLFLSAMPFAVPFYRLGRRILTSGLFPPPGSKVLFDVVIVEGKAARRKGYGLIMLSVFIVVWAVSATFILVPYTFGKIWKDFELHEKSNITFESYHGANCRESLLRDILLRRSPRR